MTDDMFDDDTTEITLKLAEIASKIEASGQFIPADIAIGFLTVGAWAAIADLGDAGAAEVFRNYADKIEQRLLQQRPN